MTVPTLTSFTDWLVADGVNKDWPYSFSLLSASDLYIQVREGLEGDIDNYTSNYSYLPTDDNSGYIRFPLDSAALAAGFYVRIVRKVPYTQLTPYGNQGAFHAEMHERSFDRATQQIQQLAVEVDRAIKVALGLSGGELILGIEGNFPMYSATNGFEDSGVSAADIAEQAEAALAAVAAANEAAADASAAAATALAAVAALQESFIIAVSDEITALTSGAGKITLRMPYAFTVSAIRASLTVAQTGGSTLTVDVNEGGVSILSTKITIDNGEKTSTTAAIPPVISDNSLADDAEITIDIDQIGDGTAMGLKVTLIGSRT